ncbi:MAG: hypothetical protein COA88_02400 [Kordia sp.]|nr:MAG: hypothetical protein COA88_02400 [Kordia sp.]
MDTRFFSPQLSSLFVEGQFPGGTTQSLVVSYSFKSTPEKATLDKAINKLISSSDALRTVAIKNDECVFMPQVQAASLAEIKYHIFVNNDGFKDWVDNYAVKPFFINGKPLIQFSVCKIETELILVVKMHHSICDAFSWKLIFDRITSFCFPEKYPVIKENPYVEFLKSTTSYLNSDQFIVDKNYWIDSFKRLPEESVNTKKIAKNLDSNRVSFEFDKKLSKEIRQFCKEQGVSVFRLMMSALIILKQRKERSYNITVGAVLHNRFKQERKETIGMMVSTVPFIIKTNVDTSVLALFGLLSSKLKEVVTHQEYPYEYILSDIRARHKLNTDYRLFDTVMSYQNAAYSEELEEFNWHHHGQDLFPMVIHISDRIKQNDSKFLLEFDYNKSLFKEWEVESIYYSLSTLVIAMMENPEQSISQLCTAPNSHIIDTKNIVNKPFKNYNPQLSVVERFKLHVVDNSLKTAITYRGTQFSYLELDQLSDVLADKLLKSGIEQESFIGICARRSEETIIGILAILKLNCTYVPIDEGLPGERQKFITEDCELDIIIGNEAALDFDYKGRIVGVDMVFDTEKQFNLPKLNYEIPAYVMYTSGSTGAPKGVVIPQSGIIRLVCNNQFIEFDSNTNFIHTGAPAFDASTFEIWGALLNGGTVHIPQNNDIFNPEALASFIEKWYVNVMWLTSGLFNFLTDNNVNFGQLKHLIVGGDVLSPRYIQRIYDTHNNLTIYNGYGPTENTTFSIVHKIPREVPFNIPLGKSFRNSEVYILDQFNKPLPKGVIGEIYVGGDGLANCYLNNPELTDSKFITESNYNLGRLYKTGDFGRFLEDDTVEFHGRMDTQVKIRGHRIEISEIEEAVMKEGGIQKVCVAIKGTEAQERELWAFIVADAIIDTVKLSSVIAEVLPEYAVPTNFFQLNDFPLTVNGKIDKTALVQEGIDVNINMDVSIEDSYSETELILANLWEEVLENRNFTKDSDFFVCGGHSIKVMQLSALLIKRYSVRLVFYDLLTAPTIRKQAELFDKRQRVAYPPMDKLEDSNCPATASQKRIYFLCQLYPDSLVYNVPLILKVKGDFKLKKAYESLYTLIQKYESLRTSFFIDNLGDLRMEVSNYVSPEVSYQSNVVDVNKCIKKFIRPFDFEKAPLIRASVIEQGNNEFVLMVDMHHMIVDGISLDILKEEFAELYENVSGSHVQNTLDFKDFASWTKYRIQDFEQQKYFWLENLKGVDKLDFPCDFIRPAQQRYEGDELSISLGADLVASLENVARQQKVTLHMLIMTAYNVLVHNYTKKNDFIVGVPVNGRIHPDVESMVGCFINLLAIRNTIDPEKSFTAHVSEVKQQMINGLAHQAYPFDLLVNELGLERDMSRNPLIDTVFVLQKSELVNLPIKDLEVSPYGYKYNIAKFDIHTEAFPEGDDIRLNINYNTALFKYDTMHQFGHHFKNILKSICLKPEGLVKDIDMLATDEKDYILNSFNKTEKDYSHAKTILNLITSRATEVPNQTAISFGTESLNYGQLIKKVNVFANHLIESGVQPNEIVGVMTYRSVEMIVAILGIMQVGATYLPLDPDYPVSRVRYMLEKTRIKKMVINRDELLEFDGLEYIDITKINFEGAKELKDILATPESLAYIIFTSGSTGNPKGVMIEQKALVNFVLGVQEKIDFKDKKILGLTTISFDIFVLETYIPLAMGGHIIIASEEQQKDSELLNQLILDAGIDYLQTTPSRLQLLKYDKLAEKSLKKIDVLMVGGEALPKSLFNEIKNIEGLRIFNMYGPTETTVWSTIQELSKKETITLGKPISNTQVYILDDKLRLMPIGVSGDVYIGGHGLARGYWEDSKLTSQQFIDNPFVEGTKIYKTGDIGKWGQNGELVYEGRADHQVKIRGYRIELGEIENALKSINDVLDVAVIADSNDAYKYLIAYYVSSEKLEFSYLVDCLHDILPEYMIPEVFIHLDELPLTPNGKLDKKALPKSEPMVESDKQHQEADTDTEKQLILIWEGILNRTGISVNDNFFEIGGNSLSIILMKTLISNEFLNALNIADIFANPTISKLAKLISPTEDSKDDNFSFFNLSDDFLENTESNGFKLLSLEMEEGMLDELTELASNFNLEVNDVFSTAFIYALYEISDSDKIEIHCLDKTNKEFDRVKIDFEIVESIEGLFQQYTVQQKNTWDNVSVNIIKERHYSVPDNGILPAFSFSNSMDYKTINHLYDLFINIEVESGNNAVIKCHYNSNKINEAALKSWVVNYEHVLDSFKSQLVK